MLLPHPQLSGILVKRYNRFLADVVPDSRCIGGEEDKPSPVTIHCPNSGSMRGLTAPGNRVWFHKSPNSKRKLHYTWDLVQDGQTLVGINTSYPNKLVQEALREGKLAPFREYTSIQPEVQVEKGTRLDFKLSAVHRPDTYIEVKNVTLKIGDTAQFPDAVTERGTKHLHSLMSKVAEGHRGALIFVVQRGDVSSFAPAWDIDPTYCSALRQAFDSGVEIYCLTCSISTLAIDLTTGDHGTFLPIHL